VAIRVKHFYESSTTWHRASKAATVDPKSFVDMSVVQELEASGLIRASG
jgi:hypothetical protein